MIERTRSLRQEQLQLSASLREQHRSWAQAADIFRQRYGVNARAALRLAHGWSQRQAADRWNERWPADPKTFKNFSYWENWPSKTGYAPSLDVLGRLAELYECAVGDLLVDYADFRHRDTAPASALTTCTPLLVKRPLVREIPVSGWTWLLWRSGLTRWMCTSADG